MKRIIALTLTLVMALAAMVGCMEAQDPPVKEGDKAHSGKRPPITMTIAETLPSCVAFEYKDGAPYCFYAYDGSEKLYRVFWTDFTGLNEKDAVVVEYNDDIRTLTYDDYPSGWNPQYEITAINVICNETASCISDEDGAYILTLPKSKQRITLRDEQRLFVPYITDPLVEAAENKITDEISKYSKNSGFYLQVTDDYLCLTVEVIKQLGMSVGGIDHKHLFFSERITLCPVYTQSDTHLKNTNDNKVLSCLSRYLNDINLVPGLSQSEFIAQIERYT